MKNFQVASAAANNSSCNALRRVAFKSCLRNIYCVAVVALMTLGNAAALTVGGNCGKEGDGDNVTYSFNTATGVLTISGTGAMADYSATSDLTTAPWGAFADLLKATVVETGVTTIGTHAFRGCGAMASFTFPTPNTITSIGSYAFRSYKTGAANTGGGLVGELVIPVGVTSMGSHVFSWTYNLTSIVLPEGLTEIPNNTFDAASALRRISFPSTITTFGSGVFYQNSALTYIDINSPTPPTWLPESPGFTVASVYLRIPAGAAAAYNAANVAPWNAFKKFNGNFLTIGQEANANTWECGKNTPGNVIASFNAATGVLSFTGTGDGLMADYSDNNMPWNAHRANIKSITFDAGVKSIGTKAFAQHDEITSLTIPSSITTLGPQMLRGCDKIEEITIQEGVTNIPYAFFDACTALKKITLPSTITSLVAEKETGDRNIFYANTSLRAIFMYAATPPTIFNDDVFQYLDATNIIVYVPNAASKSLYETDGRWTLEATIDIIGNEPPVATSWEVGNTTATNVFAAFDESTGVLSFSGTGDGLMKNFSGDNGMPWEDYRARITSITFDGGVKSIGDFAFVDHDRLTGTITVPSQITRIGEKAFRNCDSIEHFVVEGPITSIPWMLLDSDKRLRSVTFPASVTNIGENGTTVGPFYGNDSLRTITIYAPAPPTNFGRVSGMTKANLYVVSEAARTAYAAALAETESEVNCIGIIGGELCPDYVAEPIETWEVGATEASNVIAKVNYETGIFTLRKADNATDGKMIAYAAVTDQPWAKYRIFTQTLVIEEGVTNVGAHAFNNCQWLGSVTIPEGVDTIGVSAFQSCALLTSVTLPQSLVSISSSAFLSCASLTNLVLPEGIKSIKGGAFRDNKSLTSVSFPEGLLELGANSFRNTKLTSVSLPASLASFSDGAFGYNPSLTGINVNPDNETFISLDGVMYTKDRTTLVMYPAGKDTLYYIPSGVTTLKTSAFEGATPLKVVGLSSSITTINGYSFGGCTGLKSIYSSIITPPTIGADVFSGVTIANVNLFVPEGTMDTYDDLAVWTNFYIAEFTSTGMDIFPKTSTIPKDNTVALTAFLTPAGDIPSGATVTWTSSDNTIATVDASGLVTGIKDGVATITAAYSTYTATSTVTVLPVAVTDVSLNKTSIFLALVGGNTETLYANIEPANASIQTVTWVSSNAAVATVDATGKVTAVSIGTATITATTTDGNKTATCEVTVVAQDLPLTGITLSETTANLKTGVTRQLVVSFTPANATNQSITWTSSDPSVATVSNGGLVTSIAAGQTTITVTSASNSSLTATCAVTVNNPVESLTVLPVSATITKGTTATIAATVLPANATNPSLSWTSSNNAVATVADGLVSAVGVGTATITAAATDGSSLSATCAVTVPGVIAVTIDPATMSANKGDFKAFNARVSVAGNTDTTVTWAVSGNNISTTSVTPARNKGTLYVDDAETATTLIVTATSVADPTQSASATVTIGGSTAVAAQALRPLAIRPNPVVDGILHIDEQLTAPVEIYTLTGTLVLKSNEPTINISHLSSGIYLVKTGNKTAKFVKQ